jgi:hypothetical protein
MCEVSMRATIVCVAVLSGSLVAQERAIRLQMNFTASAESFDVATKEYREIWASEGERIVAAMERATRLRFETGPIGAVVYEGPSFSGFGQRPMQLRASYSSATKRATLVHELGHRLVGDLVPRTIDHHSVIFLFVYDVWVELWGQSFADEQVAIEKRRTGPLADYEGLWRQALDLSSAERARRFQQFVREHRK